MQAQKSVPIPAPAKSRSTVSATIIALLFTTGLSGLIALIFDLVVRGLGA